MRCTKCGFENPVRGRFCEECGHALGRTCLQCGHESPATAKFCGACGAALSAPGSLLASGSVPANLVGAPVLYTPAHLAERILAERAAMEARGQEAGERKTITALFADMAGSTAMIQDLDPEEARELIDPVVAIMMEAVHHYEGYVAKSLGDGILALFGAPIAHEDHPLRALYAALRMQESMRRHGDRSRLEKGIPLQIRVGIHTGEVVVRSIRKDDLHTDYDPVGHTIHIASRMEGMAVPSSVLVSDSTYKLADGYFHFKALGATNVKGIRTPLSVYELLGLGTLRTRLQVSAYRGLAKFVGRERELGCLQTALASANAKHGRIVGVAGEAGVGKSRLFHEFKVRSQQGCLVLETFSVSHGRAFPYLPLIDLLKNYFQIAASDDERLYREKVTGRLLTLDRTLEDQLPYLLDLLGITESPSTPPMMDARLRRQRTFEAMIRLLVRESQNQPVLLLFEDLQWLDSETEAFIDELVEHVPGARILLLVNYRQDYAHDWERLPCYIQLHLEPLGQTDAKGLVTTLLGDHPTLGPLKQLILAKTEGNPFFMEEVVRTLVEAGIVLGEPGSYRTETAPVSLHIPTTVQGVVASRIDRLPQAQKELLQTLAIIGKDFSLSLVRCVAALSEQKLPPLIDDLQRSDFIFERPAYPEVEYAFKHALIQEVAANSLLLSQRSKLHERTAEAIESLFPDRLDDYVNELAHHYSKSGNARKAIQYLHLAGEQALQQSAQREGIRHLGTALELLRALPDSPERTREEIRLLLTLGPAWIAARGHGSAEVEETYTQALALCERDGGMPELFSAQAGLWSHYLLRAELERAHGLAERLLGLAQNTNDLERIAEAHRALGVTLLRLGKIGMARHHMEQALTLHRPGRQSYDHLLRLVRIPAVHIRSTLSWILWYLGLADQSRNRCEEALELARAAGDPFGLALSLIFAAELYQRRDEVQKSLEYAEAAIAVSSERGFPLYEAWGTILRGWALVRLGKQEEGIVQMRLGLRAHRATRSALGRPSLLGLLADAYGRAGKLEFALRVLSHALALTQSTGERFDQPVLLRQRGELLLVMAGRGVAGIAATHKEAESCLSEAVALAREHGARSVELRCALSLARLWDLQGKRDAARQLLAEVHGTFVEGFDTRDWLDGKALLREWS
ncbi:ATP-binding protein [Cupriavidus basilensis]|uniref:ATP-binding protein n=1 Tax=Cupriavidus basilensis TaxID=68895 RepID=UPI0023E8F822|nr:adenylate/guanylate cyclase domain-containing protein [Cupriavidus basilensis]MDF3885201.1 adenylate/guanylate cyclase domain-containing protein [Cupriavidus basilensis]